MKFQTSYGQKYLKHTRNLYIKTNVKKQGSLPCTTENDI